MGVQSGVLEPLGGLGRGLEVPHRQNIGGGLGVVALAGKGQLAEPFNRSVSLDEHRGWPE